jgi:PAS domain S-box-containing protein
LVAELNFRHLLDALADAVVVADRTNRIVYVNPAAEKLLHWPEGELVGRPLTTVIPTRLRDQHHAGFARFVSTGESRLLGRMLRVPALRRDGQEVEVGLSLSAFEEDGRDLIVAALRDVRDRVELERQRDLTRYLRATSEAAARLGSRLDRGPLLETVVQTLVDDFDAALARVWTYDPGSDSLVLQSSAGLSTATTTSPRARIDLASYPYKVGRVARTRAPFFRNGLDGDAEFDQEWVARERIAAVAALPLVSAGELLGVVAYFSRRAMSDEVVAALSAFGSVIAASLHDIRMFEDVEASRVEAERQHQSLRTILDALPAGVLLIEGAPGDARVTLVNAATELIGGEPMATLPLDQFHARFPLNHPTEARKLDLAERPLWRAIERGETVYETCRFRDADGNERFLDIVSTPFPGREGAAISIYQDVTEQHRLEGELAERAGQLKALLDHLPVGVAYFDHCGVCRASNGPARRTLGRSRNEITGATAADLFAWAPALRDALARCLGEQQPHVEAGAAWPDPVGSGPPRYLDWRFEPLPAEPGQVAGALALIVDVTHRKLAEDQMRLAKENAEQTSRSKTQFLSAVSHDMRTPVNALSLQAELLALLIQKRDDPEGELAALAADIHQAAANLIELVNDLLDLTRFDSGALDFHPTEFSLDEWLGQTLGPLAITAKAKGLRFSWRSDRPGRVLHADRIKLSRVLVNLAGNAVKFTDSGEVEVTAGAAPDGRLALTVRDTGPGIPASQRERIFDEFAQLRNPERDRTKGTGLGLAICRRLVEGVGGRLTVECPPGGGSAFTAYYPPDLLAGDATAPEPTDEADNFEIPRVEVDGAILLVEDDPYSRKSLTKLIQHAGYCIEAVGDGPSAVEAVMRRRPSLILLDLMLPGMDGAEVLRRLRARHDRRALPVVVLTGDLLSGRSAQLAALDVDGMLAKPIDVDDLLRTIARHMSPARSASRRKNAEKSAPSGTILGLGDSISGGR